MITPTPIPSAVHAALLDQYNHERYSVAMYQSLAAALSSMDWTSFSKWMMAAADEEMKHVGMVFSYLDEKNAPIVVDALSAPPPVPETVLDIFGAALEHEKVVTSNWRNIYKLACDNLDPMTCEFALSMLKEQVEEEAKVYEIYFKLNVAGNDPAAVLEVSYHV